MREIRSSTICGFVVRSNHHCGDDLVKSSVQYQHIREPERYSWYCPRFLRIVGCHLSVQYDNKTQYLGHCSLHEQHELHRAWTSNAILFNAEVASSTNTPRWYQSHFICHIARLFEVGFRMINRTTGKRSTSTGWRNKEESSFCSSLGIEF